MDFKKYIDTSLLDRFEFQNYGHALEILHQLLPFQMRIVIFMGMMLSTAKEKS